MQQRRRRELRAQIAALQEQIAGDEAELKQIADREERLPAGTDEARRAMGTQRWADPQDADDDESSDDPHRRQHR